MTHKQKYHLLSSFLSNVIEIIDVNIDRIQKRNNKTFEILEFTKFIVGL